MVFLLMAWDSWLMWVNPVIDFGRELYLPWAVLHGKRPLTDIQIDHGPFSTYYNALMYHLFGSCVQPLLWSNLVWAACGTAAIYWYFLRCQGMAAGLFAALSFILIPVFSLSDASLFNFIAPYANALTHGFILAILCLLSLSFFTTTWKPRFFYLAALLVGVVFLTKPEPFLAVVVAFLLVVILLVVKPSPTLPRPISLLPGALGIALIPALLFLLLFKFLYPDQSFIVNLKVISGSWGHLYSHHYVGTFFQEKSMGTDVPLRHITLMVLSAAVLGLIMALSRSVLRLPSPPRGGQDRRRPAMAVFLAVLATIWVALEAYLLDGGFRGVSLLVLGVISWYLIKGFPLREGSGFDTRELMLLAWGAFALTLEGRVLINPGLYSFGIILSTPCVVFLAAFLVGDWCRLKPESDHEQVWIGRFAVIFLSLVLCMMAGVNHLRTRDMTKSIGAGCNRFMAQAKLPYWYIHGEVDRWVRENLKPSQTFIVLPEGLMFNFLHQVTNPSRLIKLLPPDLDVYSQEEVTDILEKARPDFILLLSRPMPEYGVASLRDYAGTVWAWLFRHYHLQETIKPPLADRLNTQDLMILAANRDRSGAVSGPTPGEGNGPLRGIIPFLFQTSNNQAGDRLDPKRACMEN
ncbi:MAG: glycosyltransferase family 39 protein [Magnetococcales bacterium]|nr:glycosyltransferase family 39 protein [Magnetococcales bacterium]